MKKLKSYLLFSKEHRSGIFALIVIIVLLQLGIYFFNVKTFFKESEKITAEEANWLSVQKEIDSLKEKIANQKSKIYPFNPNFITDYKGYTLGLSVQEVDRLHAFREEGKFVNSVEEFQRITKVSDTLLNKIASYFKFPDWVKNKNNNLKQKEYKVFKQKEKTVIKPININLATKSDLMAVYGIGDKISDIILKEKDKFGDFASIEQLQFVWGVSPEVYEEIKKRFFIASNVRVKKININEASTKELAAFPYFRYALAKEIVTYRSMNGKINKIEDLVNINDFPVEKLQIIALYLQIN